MAKREAAFPGQAPGSFFVDRTCIDCGTCYTHAPEVFEDAGEHSRVARQPADGAQTHRAAQALVACPTGSIGCDDKAAVGLAAKAFPVTLEDEVAFCGYTSEKSFGAWSYFIARPGGNVLMDCPRAAGPLMARLAELGGVATMVLSHRDDVADHAAYQERFGCLRVAHGREGLAFAERTVAGDDPVALAEDLLLIPTPGHTAGSQCLLYRETFLFTGDHLWWNPHKARLSASQTYCWHDWAQQLASLEKLRAFPFRWVLPGHGAPRAFKDTAEAHGELTRALAELARI